MSLRILQIVICSHCNQMSSCIHTSNQESDELINYILIRESLFISLSHFMQKLNQILSLPRNTLIFQSLNDLLHSRFTEGFYKIDILIHIPILLIQSKLRITLSKELIHGIIEHIPDFFNSFRRENGHFFSLNSIVPKLVTKEYSAYDFASDLLHLFNNVNFVQIC